MNFNLVLKGFISGIIVGAPFGPVGVLCMSNALRKGRIHGLLGGLGIASANMVYTLFIGFGLTIVSKLLTEYMVLFRILGGVIACFIGISLMLPATANRKAKNKVSDVTSSYLSMFLIAISNIPAIFLFLAVFSYLGVASSNLGYLSGLELAVGVFTGTFSWWLVLASKIDLIKIKLYKNSKVTPYIPYIRKAVSLCIIIFGIGIIIQQLLQL